MLFKRKHLGLKLRIFCYSNDLNIYSIVEKKKHKRMQNIQSKSVRLENILAGKY